MSFIFERVQIALFRHAHIEVNVGKTRIWNSGGVEPPGARAMGTAEEPSWVGDRTLPTNRQGLVVLGAPMGSPEFVQTSLHGARREHEKLLSRLQYLPFMQASWWLLLLL